MSVARKGVSTALVIGICALGLLAGAGSAFAETKTFTAAGCSDWEVPSGVSQLSVTATGGAGEKGGGPSAPFSGAGGKGDELSATVQVSAHEAFDVCAAQGGGGPEGGKGGGASGIARSTDFSAPVLVAGGGGAGGQGTRVCEPGPGGEICTDFPGGEGGSAGMAGGGAQPGAVEGGSKSNAAGPGAGSWVGGGGGGGGYVGGGGGGGAGPATSGGAGGTDFCGGSGVTCGATNAGAGTSTGGVTITYTTLSLPTSRKQCREGGWKNFGAMFKNHGACVEFVVHENHVARLQRQRHHH